MSAIITGKGKGAKTKVVTPTNETLATTKGKMTFYGTKVASPSINVSEHTKATHAPLSYDLFKKAGMAFGGDKSGVHMILWTNKTTGEQGGSVSMFDAATGASAGYVNVKKALVAKLMEEITDEDGNYETVAKTKAGNDVVVLPTSMFRIYSFTNDEDPNAIKAWTTVGLPEFKQTFA